MHIGNKRLSLLLLHKDSKCRPDNKVRVKNFMYGLNLQRVRLR